MDNQNSNAIQSDQQNPERDSTGETSLAKLSIEEDRGANSPAVSTLNSSMDTVTEDNLLQQSDVEETIVTSTPKQDKLYLLQYRSASFREQLEGD